MQLKQNVCFSRVLNEPYNYDEVVDAGCDKYGGKKGGLSRVCGGESGIYEKCCRQ